MPKRTQTQGLRRAVGLALALALALAPGVTRADDEIPREADVLQFVGEHQPELLTLLEALKPMSGKEYRKAIRDLLPVRDRLVEAKKRGAPRYPFQLESWKARTRVDVLAARMAGSTSAEDEAKLREAIAASLDADIKLQRFELEQAEAAARNHRRALDRLESDRTATLEARLRAAQPRKAGKIGKKTKDKERPASTAPATSPPAAPASGSAPAPSQPTVPGENRR